MELRNITGQSSFVVMLEDDKDCLDGKTSVLIKSKNIKERSGYPQPTIPNNKMC